jgi:hypothetical protein
MSSRVAARIAADALGMIPTSYGHLIQMAARYARLRLDGHVVVNRQTGVPIALQGDRKPEYRNVTNYNYGAVAAAVGYSLDEVLSNAGFYNQVRGNPTPQDTKWGIKADAVNNISQGWNDYHNKRWDPQ